MSRARHKRLMRLVAAQAAIAKAAEVRRDLAQVKRDEAVADAGKIIGALNTDSPLHGHLVGLMAGALDRNSAERHRWADTHRKAAATYERQRVRAERLVAKAEDAAKANARKAEKRELEEMSSRLRRRS